MANHSTNLNWNSPDYFKLFDDVGGGGGAIGGGGNAGVAANGISGAAAPLTANNVANANNANFGSFDFYGNSLANGIGSINNNNATTTVTATATAAAAIVSTVSSPSSSVTMINQTFQYQYQYDYGTEPHTNKSNYDGGSNFMLLMEDFSAYFYNYNGSVGSGIGTTGSTANVNGSSMGYELQNNCSIANATCNDNLGNETNFFFLQERREKQLCHGLRGLNTHSNVRWKK